MLKKIFTWVALSVSTMAPAEAVLWNGYEIQLENTRITPGEAALLTIQRKEASSLSALKVTFLNQVLFQGHHSTQTDRAYYFLPVDYYTQPGIYSLRIEDTETKSFHRMPVRVTEGVYAKETLSVDPAFTKLAPEMQARTEAEAKKISTLYEQYEPYDHTIRFLSFPLNTAVTSTFGRQRLFNHEVKSYHNGIDFRAKIGTPISAAAEGRVLIAEDLFYSGQHVAIDHGAGVVTTYSHLSKITVKVGDRVSAGDIIGLAGRTGRVTGPHLHWVVKLNTINVNPIQAKTLLQSLR